MSHGKGETTAGKGGAGDGGTETEGGKERKGEKDREGAHRENEVPAMVTGGWRKGAVGGEDEDGGGGLDNSLPGTGKQKTRLCKLIRHRN